VGARFSAPVQTGLGAHPASCTMGTGSFPGVESGRGVTLTPHSRLVPRSGKQSRAIPLLSLRAFVAYKKGETYLIQHNGMNFTKLLTRITAILKINDISSATRKYMIKDFICHLLQNSYNKASASLLDTERSRTSRQITAGR
jgi:hypothetical protein